MTLNASMKTLSTLQLDFDSRTSANKSKFIKDRVTFVEKSMGNICNTFGSIARKNGKMRDKQDELCQHILTYAEATTYNSTSKSSLTQLTRELASCNDYQDALVKRMESQVVGPLKIFDTIIKNSRDDIQKALNAYEQEQKTKKTVDSMRERNPSDKHKLDRAETELQKAKVEASRSTKALEEAIDMFEQKKLADLKSVLGTYLRIQMSYHAKCLESITRTYKTLADYNEDDDLEEFRHVLHPTSALERQQVILGRSTGSYSSLTSRKSDNSRKASPSPVRPSTGPSGKADMFSAKSSRMMPSPQSKSTPQKQTKSVMMGGDDTGSEDEDDEDEGDDDEDEDDEESGSELEEIPIGRH